MPDIYEIEIDGQVYEVEADSIEGAAKAAKQFVGQNNEARLSEMAESYNEAPAQKLLREIFGGQPVPAEAGTYSGPMPEAPPTDIGYGLAGQEGNPVADALAKMMLTGIALGGPAQAIAAGGASAGVPGALRALLPLTKRAVAGGAVGGILGEVPIPFLGKLGAKEGAMIGAGYATGKGNIGGTGPLMKHGAKVGGLKRFLRMIGLAGEESGGAVKGAVKGAAKGASKAADDVPARMSTTTRGPYPRAVPAPKTMSVPAPGGSVAQQEAGKILETVQNMKAQGMSRGQLVDILREQHGIQPKDAKNILDLFM